MSLHCSQTPPEGRREGQALRKSPYLTGAVGPFIPLFPREEAATNSETTKVCLQQGSLSQKVSGATLGMPGVGMWGWGSQISSQD